MHCAWSALLIAEPATCAVHPSFPPLNVLQSAPAHVTARHWRSRTGVPFPDTDDASMALEVAACDPCEPSRSAYTPADLTAYVEALFAPGDRP